MAQSERLKWCSNKVEEAFKPDLEAEIVHQFIRNDKNSSKFAAFFRGESSGRLFVFYQPEGNSNGEVGLLLMTKNRLHGCCFL